MKLHRILLASALILASCNRVTDYTSLHPVAPVQPVDQGLCNALALSGNREP